MTIGDPPEAETRSGRATIGRFEVLAPLGSGGTADVVAARDTATGERVALKLLHNDLGASPEHREEFLAEARTVARIGHPGVVRVLDVGELARDDAPPQAWVAMEVIPGVTLARWVAAHGPLDVVDALTLVEALLHAVEAVHRAGLVHRDITPANVMFSLTPGIPLDGADVRLLDFGLAGAPGTATWARTSPGAEVAVVASAAPGGAADADVDGASAPAGTENAAVPHGPALIWGSAPFLSPEQATASSVFETGDVYQVGALLYFALTGRAPFVRDSAEEVLRAHVSDPLEPPSVHRADVPQRVDRLIWRAMQKQPGARFGSAQEMAGAVREARTATLENQVNTAQLDVVTGQVFGGYGGALAGAGAGLGAAYATVPSTGFAAGPIGTGTLPGNAAHQSQHTNGAPDSFAGALPDPTSGPGLFARRRARRGAALTLTILLVGIAVGVGALVAVMQGSDSARVVSASTDQAAAAAVNVEPTPSPAATQFVVVPDVVGMPIADARAALARAGIGVGEVTTSHGRAVADTVLATGQIAGARVPEGSVIAVTVASGMNAIPSLIDLTPAEAMSAITAAGFLGSATGGTPASGPNALNPPVAGSTERVVAMSPAAGTIAPHGTQITFTVQLIAPATPSPAPAPVDPNAPADPPPATDPLDPADPTPAPSP